ncbi:haloacid dehalogenase, partial [Halobacteriales archaeon SW_10_68_16]
MDTVGTGTGKRRPFAGRDPDLGRSVARAYAEARDHTDVRPLPGARETLEHLQESVALGAVTNGSPAMQSTKLDTLGFGEYFETVVHGGYDAPAKPAPDPFHAALDALGVAPGRAVHVGNSVASDVAGAKRAGVRA